MGGLKRGSTRPTGAGRMAERAAIRTRFPRIDTIKIPKENATAGHAAFFMVSLESPTKWNGTSVDTLDLLVVSQPSSECRSKDLLGRQTQLFTSFFVQCKVNSPLRRLTDDGSYSY